MYNQNDRSYLRSNASVPQPASQPAGSDDVSQDTSDFQGPEGIAAVGISVVGMGSSFTHTLDRALDPVEHSQVSQVPGSHAAPFPSEPSVVAVSPFNTPYGPYPNGPVHVVSSTRRSSAGQRGVKAGRIVKPATTQMKKGGQLQWRDKDQGNINAVDDGHNEARQGDTAEEGDGKLEQKEKVWACPFCVANPKAHIDCWTAVCRRFHDLIQHIKRKHCKDSNSYCPRCYNDYETEVLMKQHFEVCNHLGPPRFDLINDEELDRITNKSKFTIPLNDVERWFAIWVRICPNRPMPCLPYATRSDYLDNLICCRIVDIDSNHHHGVSDPVNSFDPMAGMTSTYENEPNCTTLQHDSIGIENHPTTTNLTNQNDWCPTLSPQDAHLHPVVELDHNDGNAQSGFDPCATQFNHTSEDGIGYNNSFNEDVWSHQG